MHPIYAAAVITQTLIACLTGQIQVAHDEDISGVVYCPAYFGTRMPTSEELGVYKIPPQNVATENFCAEQRDWCDVVLVSSVQITSLCPDLFVVGTVEQEGKRWYGMYFYPHPDCPVPARIEGGYGVVIAFSQARDIEFLDASGFFASPNVPEQLVPADVVNSKAVSFLPPDRTIRAGSVHIISLMVGICIIAGQYALRVLPFQVQKENYSGE